MRVKGAAAGLSRWNNDFDTVLGQYSYGGAIQLGKRYTRDATCQQRYSAATFTNGRMHGSNFPEIEVTLDRRRECIQIGNPHEFQQSDRSQDLLQPGTLVEPDKSRVRRKFPKIVQHRAEEMLSKFSAEPGTLIVDLDLGACALQDAPILNP
jgi:hypothetical protein